MRNYHGIKDIKVFTGGTRTNFWCYASTNILIILLFKMKLNTWNIRKQYFQPIRDINKTLFKITDWCKL